jgi:hypothetical protein
MNVLTNPVVIFCSLGIMDELEDGRLTESIDKLVIFICMDTAWP